MNAEKPKIPRWYVVTEKVDGGRCLVEASNQAQAFRRTAEHYCTARPATVNEAIEMTREGADVLSAPVGPEQLDLEDELSAEEAARALPNSAVLGAGPLEPDPYLEGITKRVVPGGVATPEKGEQQPEAPSPSGASGSLTGSHALDAHLTGINKQRVPGRLASEVFGAGFNKDRNDE